MKKVQVIVKNMTNLIKDIDNGVLTMLDCRNELTNMINFLTSGEKK